MKPDHLKRVERFSVRAEGLFLHGVIHLPEALPAPCVICSHGLFSSKASHKFTALAEYLSEAGFVAVRYDHRGCGESEGRIEETTVGGRLADLIAVLDDIRKAPHGNGTIGLMGSSLGGVVSVLAAARDASVKALCIWASPSALQRGRKLQEDAGHPVLNPGFYEEARNHPLAAVLGRIRNCMVLHGEKDEIVPVAQAFQIYRGLAEPKGIEIFAGGDHRFTRQQDRLRAMELTAAWFKKHLFA